MFIAEAVIYRMGQFWDKVQLLRYKKTNVSNKSDAELKTLDWRIIFVYTQSDSKSADEWTLYIF